MSILERSRSPTSASLAIATHAIGALFAELALYPKPGLVSFVDSGAHDDMDAGTFLRSLRSLRGYFASIAEAGAADAPFEVLQELGVTAEYRMLAATGGVNTHRGAIFCLGLLAAAAGWRRERGLPLAGAGLVETISVRWSSDIAKAGCQSSAGNGSRAVRLYGARGAREEALQGFPTLIGIALPTLNDGLSRGWAVRQAMSQTLLAVMANFQDTNLLHRGGPAGLAFVQDRARALLEEGGAYHRAWRDRAVGLHRDCIERRLSPGGAADVLAAACFIRRLQP